MSEQERHHAEVGAQQEQRGLFAALVKAQGAMGGAVKDSNNSFFKSKYADLASVMEAIRPAFAANGLGFIQVIHDAENSACVETIIIHESGASFACGRVSVPVSKGDAQGYGSAITYAKRYSLQAAVGVPSVDDDGNGATKAPPKAEAKPEPKAASAPEAPIVPLLTEEQVGNIVDLCRETKFDVQEINKRAGVDVLAEIANDAYPAIVAFLDKRRAKMNEAKEELIV